MAAGKQASPLLPTTSPRLVTPSDCAQAVRNSRAAFLSSGPESSDWAGYQLQKWESEAKTTQTCQLSAAQSTSNSRMSRGSDSTPLEKKLPQKRSLAELQMPHSKTTATKHCWKGRESCPGVYYQGRHGSKAHDIA